jgi:DNA mismatch repair protein MutS
MNDNPLKISLLSPYGANADPGVSIPEQTVVDLAYDAIVNEMIADRKNRDAVLVPAKTLCRDADVLNYRYDILDDLFRNPDIITAIESILPRIHSLRYYALHPGKTDATPLQETVWRLRELENYVFCINSFHKAFSGENIEIKSQGLSGFRDIIMETVSEKAFRQLKSELPEFLGIINSLKSITVGINLNDGLVPIEAAVIAVNPKPLKESTFFARITGQQKQPPVGALHSIKDSSQEEYKLLAPLFRDLSDILGKSLVPLRDALARYGKTTGLMFVNLFDDFLFYLGAYNMISRLRGLGLPMTRPHISGNGGKHLILKDSYNIHLALSAADGSMVVRNDFDMTDQNRIFVLTGPNSGGKTTFLQGLGLIQIMAQVGLYVPAAEAAISICDNIFTHYPVSDDVASRFGRFEEEARRLQSLVMESTARSMLLLNETFSSTSAGEAYYLAEDILHVFSRNGSRVIFATHLHQLAEECENFRFQENCKAVSLVAGISENEDGTISPTFLFARGKPSGRSYARELARKYGIDRDHLIINLY